MKNYTVEVVFLLIVHSAGIAWLVREFPGVGFAGFHPAVRMALWMATAGMALVATGVWLLLVCWLIYELKSNP